MACSQEVRAHHQQEYDSYDRAAGQQLQDRGFSQVVSDEFLVESPYGLVLFSYGFCHRME